MAKGEIYMDLDLDCIENKEENRNEEAKTFNVIANKDEDAK